MGIDIAGVATLTSTGTVLSLDGTVSNVMKVNASGILTRSITPYMRGQLSGKGNPYSASPLLVTAGENIGSCWNDATGLFTCPIAGYYLMTGGNIANTQAGYFYLNKNGATQHYTHWNHTAGWHYITLSGVISCAAGDTLSYTIGGFTPATGVGFYGEGGHCMYSIALMA